MTNQANTTVQVASNLPTVQRDQGNVDACMSREMYELAAIATARSGANSDFDKLQAKGFVRLASDGWVSITQAGERVLESHGYAYDPKVGWLKQSKGIVHKFASGEWMHLFGPGSKETQCRIVIDLEQSKLIAAQEWTGLKFEDVLSERLKDLSESVIGANDAHDDPSDWGLEVGNELPDWAEHENAQGKVQKSAMNMKTWNLMYVLANHAKVSRVTASACNPLSRAEALASAETIAKSGGGLRVWVEHCDTGERIYQSRAEQNHATAAAGNRLKSSVEQADSLSPSM